jgi:type II secretory pathway component PulJ
MGQMRSMRRSARGQTVVEYLMATVLLVSVFAGLYAFMQKVVKQRFVFGARMILRSYH